MVSLVVSESALDVPGMDAEFRFFREQLEAGEPGVLELRLCDDTWAAHHTYRAP